MGQSSAPPVSGWYRCAHRRAGRLLPPRFHPAGCGGSAEPRVLGVWERGMPGNRGCTDPLLAAKGARGAANAQLSAGLALRWDLREVCVSLVNHHGCSYSFKWAGECLTRGCHLKQLRTSILFPGSNKISCLAGHNLKENRNFFFFFNAVNLTAVTISLCLVFLRRNRLWCLHT